MPSRPRREEPAPVPSGGDGPVALTPCETDRVGDGDIPERLAGKARRLAERFRLPGPCFMAAEHDAERPYRLSSGDLEAYGACDPEKMESSRWASRVWRTWPIATPSGRDEAIAALRDRDADDAGSWNFRSAMGRFDPREPGVFMAAAGRRGKGVEAVFSARRSTRLVVDNKGVWPEYAFEAHLLYTTPAARGNYLAAALLTAACQQIQHDVAEAAAIVRKRSRTVRAMRFRVSGEALNEGGLAALDALHATMCAQVDFLKLDHKGAYEIEPPANDYGL